MKKNIASIAIVFFLLLSGEAIGQNLAPVDMLTVKGHYIHSANNGKTYQLFVILPDKYSPKDTTHYPVLYVLDGYYSFPLVYATRRALGLGGQIENVIIVSIADSVFDEQTWFASRWSDYTPSHSTVDDSSTAKEMRLPQGTLQSGGASAFLNTLKNQIIPYIDKQYKTTNDRGIIGHSIGGLFTAYCLLTAPDVFKRYGINSPSLWWDHKKLFDMEKSFSEKNKILDAQVFISVGSLENGMMKSSMSSFADSLKTHNYRGLMLSSYIFDNENHLSVIPAMMSRTLRVLYGVKED
jgi:predicted alpha/beta superfamily hydrolase